MNESATLQDTDRLQRRVFLLDTDERGGLVASLALECHKLGVSIEITTGLNHILLTFQGDQKTTDSVVRALGVVPGVHHVHPYSVLSAS